MELVDYLLYEPDDDGILWIRMNRPERMNALAPDTLVKIGEYMEAGDADPAVRVIVVTGVGRGFCSGVDLKGDGLRGDPARGPDGNRQGFMSNHREWRAISDTRKPTIAMINGPAAGGGFDLALRCDLRVGCEQTRFFTYQNIGQIFENGGYYFLPRIVGYGRAMEVALTGGWLEAGQAYEWGLLNRLTTSEELEPVTRELCQKLIDSPPLVQWLGKRIMRRGLDSTLEATLDLGANAAGILSAASDSEEALNAFLEGRRPRFEGG